MKITRRQFLKYASVIAGSVGFMKLNLIKVKEALANPFAPKVVWLQAGGCTGCSVSLLNRIAEDPVIGDENAYGQDFFVTDVADLLLNEIDLRYHPTVMAGAGEGASNAANDTLGEGFVLVVEGAVSAGENGNYCHVWEEDDGFGTMVPVTAQEAVRRFAGNPQCLGTVAIGCAAFGGIPGGTPNPTGVMPLQDIVADVVSTNQRPVNIPGCPIHPDWVVETIVRIISAALNGPEDGKKTLIRAGILTDSDGKPDGLYPDKIHTICPNRGLAKAQKLGDPGCLRSLGCKGPVTSANCPLHKWNNGQNWCIGANSVCMGCTLNGFPDEASPFYSAGEGTGGGGGGGKDKEPNPNKPPK